MGSLDPEAAIDVLIGFSRRLSDRTDASEMLPQLADTADDALGADAVVVCRVGPEGRPRLVAERGLAVDMRHECEAIEFLDPDLGERLVARLGGFAEASTYLLVSAHDLFGALVLFYREPGPREPGRVKLAAAMADLAAMALDRAHQSSELRHTIDRLRESQQELARAEQLRVLGQMAAVVAHEVKNPLASIMGAMQVIRGRLIDESTEQQVVDKLIQRVDDLNEMVEELLVFARPGKPVRQRVDLRRLIGDAVLGLSGAASLRGVEVDVRGDEPVLHADPRKLRGAFHNLFVNAGQAMDGEGRIEVAIEVTPGRCLVTVADDGPGIPADTRDRVFDPFFTTRARGTGLGLAVVQQVIESHEGTIAVDCPAGGGTVFTITLPVAG